jgi:amino acid transporter
MTNVAAPGSPPEANLDTEGMERGISFLGLLWASEASLIGSGWLFGALSAATIAGPSAIIAWCVATVIVAVLALIHAELGGLFPVSGGTSRFPHYAFGSFAGATFGWMSYLQAAAVAPIEVLAAVEYFSTVHFARHWYNGTKLTGFGIPLAIILVGLFTFVNLVGVRWLARVNNTLTWWKVLIPVLTIIVFLIFKFHGSNFSHGGGFFVKGEQVKDILIAIPSGGIVFSLLGFEQAVQLGGEARNPKDVPRAVIASLIIGATIYILLQVAFIGAIKPSLLAHAGTWANLGPTSSNATVVALNAAPFHQVAELAGLAWLALLLRIDAVVSPFGTGLIYLTSGSRILFALSKNGYVPPAFENVSGRARVPVAAILLTAVVGVIFLLPFPSWAKLVNVVTSASVLMYAGAPLALGALRLQKPDLPRSYRLPAAGFMAPAGFAAASLIVYFSGWTTYSTLLVAILLGYALIGVSFAGRMNPNQPKLDMRAAPWVLTYLVGMGIISYLGDFGPGGIIGSVGIFKHVLDHGGNDTSQLSLYVFIGVTIAFSLVIYYWALATRLNPEQVDHYVRDVYPPPAGEG